MIRDRKATRSSELGLLGAFAVLAIGLGVSTFITVSETKDPGAMDWGFGRAYSGALVFIFVGVLVWVVWETRRLEPGPRKRQYAFIVIGALGAVAVFGILTTRSIDQQRERDRALEATADWRHDFERDLADAYWAWYAESGGTESIYSGNGYEFWSLDPDRDGLADSDAPILRALDDVGWAQRGVAVFDTNGDDLIDQLEWRPETGSDKSQAWCVPVGVIESDSDIVLPEWWRARPESCA